MARSGLQRQGAWSRFLSWFSRKENPVGRLLMAHKVGQPQWSQRNLAAFAREGFQLNPYVFRAVDTRAKAIGGLRWYAARRRRDGTLDEVESHPLSALMRRPQPRKGGARFLYEVEAQLCIAGNAYVVGAGPDTGANAGRPRELWTLRPDLVKPIPGDGPMLPVRAYRFESNAGLVDFDAPKVLHLAFFNPQDDFFGMSPLEPGGRSVDHNNAARAWNVALLQNGAKPDGTFSTEGGLTPDQRQAIMEQYRNERSGPENAGLPLFLEGGLKWEQQGLSPKEMDWLEGTRLSSREISTVYGVPPELLGDTPSKAYASYVEARKAFYQDTVLPEADMIRDELNAYLAAYDAELEYDRDAIEALREDRERLFLYIGAAWQTGLLRKNEARSALGYDEDPDGDVYIDDGFSEIPTELPGLDASPVPAEEDDGEEPDEPEDDADEDEEEPDGLKGLGLSKAGQRILLYKSIDRRRQRWIRAIKMSAGKRLQAQRIAIVNAVEGARDPGSAMLAADEAILEQYDAWGRFYKSLYQTVGADFGRVTVGRLKAQAGPTYTKASDETERLVEQLIDEWLRRHSGTKIQSILDTDLDRVRKELAEGVSAGESTYDLAKRIDSYLEPLYANRAETVARSEVIPASHLGSQMAARATGLPARKSWISTPGVRTRASHQSADGQTVGLDEPYVVGGSRLMFPGDGSMGAPADEVVNCRCAESYELQETP